LLWFCRQINYVVPSFVSSYSSCDKCMTVTTIKHIPYNIILLYHLLFYFSTYSVLMQLYYVLYLVSVTLSLSLSICLIKTEKLVEASAVLLAAAAAICQKIKLKHPVNNYLRPLISIFRGQPFLFPICSGGVSAVHTSWRFLFFSSPRRISIPTRVILLLCTLTACEGPLQKIKREQTTGGTTGGRPGRVEEIVSVQCVGFNFWFIFVWFFFPPVFPEDFRRPDV